MNTGLLLSFRGPNWPTLTNCNLSSSSKDTPQHQVNVNQLHQIKPQMPRLYHLIPESNFNFICIIDNVTNVSCHSKINMNPFTSVNWTGQLEILPGNRQSQCPVPHPTPCAKAGSSWPIPTSSLSANH